MLRKVIGASIGRSGTYSFELAGNQLGFGPSHHLALVLNLPTRQHAPAPTGPPPAAEIPYRSLFRAAARS